MNLPPPQLMTLGSMIAVVVRPRGVIGHGPCTKQVALRAGVIGPGLVIRSKEGLSVGDSGSGGARLWFRDQISLETVRAAQKQGSGGMQWGKWEP